MLVTITRRNGHTLHSERHGIVEKGRHLWRGLALEQSAIDGYPETPLERFLNRFHRFVEYSRAANRGIVADAIAVELNRKSQIAVSYTHLTLPTSDLV